MINENKNIVIDLDGTLCNKYPDSTYLDAKPIKRVIKRLKEYKKKGFYIIIFTSRNMRTHKGNIGKINADTLKTIHEWLEKHNVPFDEIHIGKPWQGKGGFYVDDKTIRPSEFISKSYDEILDILE